MPGWFSFTNNSYNLRSVIIRKYTKEYLVSN